jgi:hypothetical protein
MARRIQFRRGTTAQHATFVGAPGEITVDTDKNVIVVHDGATPGGFPANRLESVEGTTTLAGQVQLTSGIPSTSVSTGSLVVQGGVGISGTLYVQNLIETSSIAFKEDVNALDNSLDSILQLTGVSYVRKNTKEKEVGFIAEQVNTVIPELVSKDENGNPYGVNYSKLTAYLVEAIKDLQNQINELKNKD